MISSKAMESDLAMSSGEMEMRFADRIQQQHSSELEMRSFCEGSRPQALHRQPAPTPTKPNLARIRQISTTQLEESPRSAHTKMWIIVVSKISHYKIIRREWAINPIEYEIQCVSSFEACRENGVGNTKNGSMRTNAWLSLKADQKTLQLRVLQESSQFRILYKAILDAFV